MAIFQRGDQVEVCCKGKGFKGAYYAATVISEINPNEFIVQYNTLLRDDELGPLREIISAVDLRPVPPELVVADGFEVEDVVDVYVNEGWWMGKVARKLVGRGKRYLVHFEKNGDVGEYKFCELRVHQDWVHGSWSISKNIIVP